MGDFLCSSDTVIDEEPEPSLIKRSIISETIISDIEDEIPESVRANFVQTLDKLIGAINRDESPTESSVMDQENVVVSGR